MTTYIGIDVGKKELHAYFGKDQLFKVFPNSQKGLEGFLKKVKKLYEHQEELMVIFETTGGYERKLRAYLESQSISFSLVHPLKVRNYAKAKGIFAKTDKIDSKLLHDYAVNFKVNVKAYKISPGAEALKSLTQRRQQLILFKNQEISRLDREPSREMISSLKKHIAYIEKELSHVEESIKDLCQKDEQIKKTIAQLTSIPGVGIVLATTVICECAELGQIDFRQLTSLVGLSPFARESGSYKGNRHIHGGRSNLRKVLYMAAVASLRVNKRLKAFYDHLIARHKAPKVALVAVMRKLLGFMNALIENNSYWVCS